ncbi:MAG: DUF456 domain-containing protein [Phycisphaerales bacterium]|nr:DUF456 domain-containing protein [Phycisphaerales bacterium]
MLYSNATLFALLGALCGVLVLFGLPGIWMMIALAIVNEFANDWWLGAGGDWRAWTAIALAVGLALGAEAVEFIAGAVGARTGGSSKWGMVGAMMGAVIGAIAGTVLIPIPIVGTLGGAALGAAFGAIVGEICGAKKSLKESVAPAVGAASGRILGTLAKFPFAIAAWLILVVGAFWR